MKTLIATLLVLFTWSENERGLLVREDLIMLVIDQNTTELELKSYKRRLKDEFKIDMEYSLAFDRRHQANRIRLNVNCNDGFRGKMESVLFSGGEKVGFFRNYNKEAEVSFSIGRLQVD